jgi:hypothetical protein
MPKTIRDFYMRVPGDPKYIKDTFETTDEIEETVSQIRMTLLTEQGEVLGEPQFGVDVDKYLFDFDINPFALSADAERQIDKYVTGSRKREIQVRPAKYTDEKQREVFVLGVEIKGRTSFALLYD